MQLGGSQNEHQMSRGLLQNFQQGVKRGRGEHMHLVHDIHALTHGSRSIDCLIPQGAHLIHTVVGSGVQLQHIQNGAVLDPQAGGTGVAGISALGVLTVDRPGQDLGAACLTGTAGAGKEISVGGASSRHLLFERLGDMGLTHHVVKGLGPPFAVEGLIHQITRFFVKN